MSRKQRKQLIEPELREPSISRQCQLFSLGRSSFYYAPVPLSAEDLELMRQIDSFVAAIFEMNLYVYGKFTPAASNQIKWRIST